MQEKTLTAKGSKQAEAVLEAAIRCLGEDGYAGTSLQRIADAAGVQKRMVLYYYDSREQLMAAALQRLADDFLTDMEARLGGMTDPGALTDTLVAMLLEQAKERRLLAAYVGLVAESATDPVLHDTLAGIETRALALADRVLDALEAAGRELTMERRLLVLSARVIANGLALELLQRGVTPELERGLALGAAGAPLLLFE